MASKRKHKLPTPAVDLITLGSSTSNPPSVPSIPKFGQKRPDISAPLNLATKKPKSATSSLSAANFPKTSTWEERAILLSPNELIQELRRVDNDSDDHEEYIEKLLCGAARSLRDPRNSSNGHFIMSLIYFSKTRPLYFCSEIIVQAFSSLLRRDPKLITSKLKNIVPSLAINLFLNAFHDETSWPESFIYLFIEDSLGDRVWVDNDDCKEFVDILTSTFKTKMPEKALLQTTDIHSSKQSEATNSPHVSSGLDDMDEASCSSNPSIYSDHSKEGSSGNTFQIYSRYAGKEVVIFKKISSMIETSLNQRPNISDVHRGILKLLMSACGVKPIRLFAAQRLEIWFQNTRLCRPAQDLLLTVCINCSVEDVDTITTLLKMKLKNKILHTHFVNCLKQLVTRDEMVSTILMKMIFYTDLEAPAPSNFNTCNSQIFIYYFQNNPSRATRTLAQFYFERILNNPDVQYLQKLRQYLRETVSKLRNEHFIHELFLSVLFDETASFSMKPEFQDLAPAFKGRIAAIIYDYVTIVLFLTITPAVREAFSQKSVRRELRRVFQNQVAVIQTHTVHWIAQCINQKYISDRATILTLLYRAVFLDTTHDSYQIDGWPSENERLAYIPMISQVPVYEATMENALNIMETESFIAEEPRTKLDSINICYNLVYRAATLYDGDERNPVIIVNNLRSIVDRFFTNIEFICAEAKNLPPGFVKPKFSSIDHYWKVWSMVVIFAAHNSKFGKEALAYPTFMMLIEMAITNNYTFQRNNEELQYENREKLEIFEFESYLGQKNIDESNSFLLKLITKLDPFSVARMPPQEYLKEFELLCKTLCLGNFLCQNRDPDFLKIIIEKQKGTAEAQNSTASMPWLNTLVESYEDRYEFLPIPALCQYLFGQIAEELQNSLFVEQKNIRKDKRRKQIKLVLFFQNLVLQKNCQLLEDLFLRLSSSIALTRTLAFKTLHMIFSINVVNYLENLDENCMKSLVVDQNDSSWLDFVTFQNENQRLSIIESIEKALMVETDPKLVVDYFVYLSINCGNNISSLNIDRISTSFTTRQKLYDQIIVYSDVPETRVRFLNAIFKIYAQYLLFLDTAPNPTLDDANSNWVKFENKPVKMSMQMFQTCLLLLPLAECPQILLDAKNVVLSKFLAGARLPLVFKDQKLKKPVKILGEKEYTWIVVKMLRSNSKDVVDIVLSQLSFDFILQEIVFRQGMSNMTMVSILYLLDLNSTRINNNSFNKENILNVLETLWSIGIPTGYEFARVHLNYKPPTAKTEVMDTAPLKSAHDKNEIVEISKNILREFFLQNTTGKFPVTLNFLKKFNKNVPIELIQNGTYNSIFNTICVQCHRRPQDVRGALLPEINRIKKEFDDLIESGDDKKIIQKTVFYLLLQEFDVFKTDQRSSPKKKKPLERQFSKWAVIRESLAVDKMFSMNHELIDKPDMQSSDGKSFKEIIFFRQRPHILSQIVHKSSTRAIADCLRFLFDENLGEKLRKNRINASAILDFIELYYDTPKMMLCAETIKSKKDHQHEDVLGFSDDHIRRILDLVIFEDRIASRVDLVFKVCCVTPPKMRIARNYLNSQYSIGDSRLKSLQAHLYMNYPAFGELEKIRMQYEPSMNVNSHFDKVAHHLVTAATFTESHPAISDQRFESWEYSLLVFARHHPRLIVRQIPVLASIFKGFIITKSFDVMKERKMMRILSAMLDFFTVLLPKLKWSGIELISLVEIVKFYQALFLEHHKRNDKINYDLLPLWEKFRRFVQMKLNLSSFGSCFGQWFLCESKNLDFLSRKFSTPVVSVPESWYDAFSVDGGVKEEFQDRPYNPPSGVSKFKELKKFLERKKIDKENKKPVATNEHLTIQEYINRVKKFKITPSLDDDIFLKIFNAPVIMETRFRSGMDILMIWFKYHDDNTTDQGIRLYLSYLDSNEESLRYIAFHYLPQVTLLYPKYRFSLIRRAFYRTLSRKLGAEEILLNTVGAVNDSLF